MARSYMDPFSQYVDPITRKDLPTKKIQSNYIEDGLNVSDPYRVADTLDRGILSELKKHGYIEYRKELDPYTQDMRYRAQLVVADQRFAHVFVDENGTAVGNEVFTDEEVQKALKKMYPERLI